MSFICKQIRLPPLFPTVKDSICVIATLEKKWMSCLRFFSSCSGDLFATAIVPLPRTRAARLGCLWHSRTPESQQLLLRAGRAAPGQPCPLPGDSDSCVTSPLCSPLCHRVGDRVVLLCAATKRSFPCIAAFRRFTVIAQAVKRFYSRRDLGHRYYFYYVHLQRCGKRGREKSTGIPIEQNTAHDSP